MFGATLVAGRRHLLRQTLSLSFLAATLSASSLAGAQVPTFAGNAQHTNVYSVSGKTLNSVLWSTPIDTNSGGQFAHYGQPLVSAANTVIVPRLLTGLQFEMHAFDGATGTEKYVLSSDYIYPAQDSWLISFQPCLVGTRLYYPGAGGTLWYVDNVDSNTPTAPTQVCFYGLSTYLSNTAGYNGCVFIDTPITADSQGNLFFGFRVQNTPVAPFFSGANGDVSGWARVSSTGVGTYVFVDAMTSDPLVTRDSHCLAPALSNDESTVYVVGKQYNSSYHAYLCGLDSTTLATKYTRFIQDPRPSGISAAVHESGTACPLVAPDGDVYLGCFVNPYNGSRGFLAHYSGDLATVKTPGAFGWDYTPGIVPASMVPSYHGNSPYLLFCKYNNYIGTGQDDGGDGINTLAILDPNDETQIDWHPQAAGMTEMREVMKVIGVTPDSENPSVTYATREWCVNATAVNPSTDSVFFNSEDGSTYRWNLTQNSLVESRNLTTGFGEPYVPQALGPDGTLYTFNGTYAFAIGEDPNVKVTLDSSEPDNKTALQSDIFTFTANVSGGAQAPTGTVTFTDAYYDDRNLISSQIGSPVNIVAGQASVTTSLIADLTGTNTKFGNHFITATYSGDVNHPAASITRIQKVHSNASSVDLQATPNAVLAGGSVTLQATVSGVASSNVPNEYVTFRVGNKVLGQVHTDGSGIASLSTTAIPAGTQTVTAEFVGDTQYAASTGSVDVDVADITSLSILPNVFRAGQTTTGFVTLTSNAPTGGATVNLSSDTWHATVPATLNIPAGSNQGFFTINGFNSTTANIVAHITASLVGSKQAPVTVQPCNFCSFVSQSVPTSMNGGSSYPVSIQYKNTGTTTWTVAAGYKLQFRNPIDGTTWASNRMPMTTDPVAPGATATFSMNVTAPSAPGTYNFQWAPIEDSINQVFGPNSPNVVVTVTVAPDAAQYISRTGATTVSAGNDFWVQNTMKNVGTNTWTSSGGYSMMTVNPDNDPTWTRTRLYMPSNSTITPGSQVTFTGLCTAPVTPGMYTMRWRCNKNGTQFGDYSPLLNITVTQGTDGAQFVSETPVPTIVGTSTTFNVQFTMKNTGTGSWSAFTHSLLPIGSNNFGVASITSPTVTPTNNGNFPAAGSATFTAPVNPGTYTFQWRMADGATKFGEPTPLITITVTTSDASQWISRTGPTTVFAGQDFWVQNTMRNTGDTTWTSSGGYQMMTVNPNNDPTWTATRAYMPANSTISTGASATFTALCTAPITPGFYTMQWQTDRNGVTFGEKSPLLNMTVSLGPDDAQFISNSGVPTTIVHGTTFNATVTMKNLGTATWGAGYSLVPIGSNTFGVASIPATTTAQNANDGFTQTFTAPATPGTYKFQMRMQNGSTKFGEPSAAVTITVT